MHKITAQEIQQGFIEYCAQWLSMGKLERQSDGQLVFIGTIADAAPQKSIPLRLSNDQWIKYYWDTLEQDGYEFL